MTYILFHARHDAGASGRIAFEAIADIYPPSADIGGIMLDIPKGGRKISAIEAAARIAEILPGEQLSFAGDGEIFVSRRTMRSGILAMIMQIALVLLLFFGSALAITFFHADVNMAQAQQTLSAMLGGGELTPLQLAIPYAIGVFVGVGAFFLLGGKKRSPLSLKLQDYRKQLEDSGEE